MKEYDFVDKSLDVLSFLVSDPSYDGVDLTELFEMFNKEAYGGITFEDGLKIRYTPDGTFSMNITEIQNQHLITIRRRNSITDAEELVGSLEHIDLNSTIIKLETDDKGKIEVLLNGRNVEITKVAPNGATQTTKITTTITTRSNSKKTATHKAVLHSDKTPVVENTVNKETFATQENIVEIQEIPLFCNSEGKGVIYKGRNNLLYAPPKTGKNRLAYSIAQSVLIKHPLFFLLEDPHGDAERQCRDALGGKVEIVTRSMWNKYIEDDKNSRQSDANVEAMKDQYIPGYHQAKQLLKQNYAAHGISDYKKLDAVALLNRILERKLGSGIDFVCLDHLKALLGSVSNITTGLLEELLRLPSQNHITFLVLHHTKKESIVISGSAALEENFDSIYRLIRSETDKSLLILDETCRRQGDEHTVRIIRTFDEKDQAYHEIQSVEDYLPQQKKGSPDYYETAKTLIQNWPHDSISFDEYKTEMVKSFPDTTDTTLKNYLKRLLDDKLVEKTNNRWATIKIIKTG